MARKVGQIIARGERKWLIRVYLGRDQENNKRRHSAAMNALAAGVSPEVVSVQLGHASTAFSWTRMLMCFHTCRTKPLQGSRQRSLERGHDD